MIKIDFFNMITVSTSLTSYNINICSGLNSLDDEQLNTLKDRQIIIIKDANIISALQTPYHRLPNVTEIHLDVCGEDVKNFNYFNDLCNKILALKPTRRTVLIAIGGGTVGDLVGFVASVMLRGIDFIQYPTTLLSMVDSSVGGKTGINTLSGKNTIGTFHQPIHVVCDTNFLSTLSNREYISGYGEVLKYGLMWSEEFLEFLLCNEQNIILRDPKTLRHIIQKSCEIKTKIVSLDEKETNGIRDLLNFGHTFGHAIERMASKRKISVTHGEAVAYGMLMAMGVSEKIFNVSLQTKKITQHINDIGFTASFETIRRIINGNCYEMLEIMSGDKKNIASKIINVTDKQDRKYDIREDINLILLKSIGEAVNRPTNFKTLENLMN